MSFEDFVSKFIKRRVAPRSPASNDQNIVAPPLKAELEPMSGGFSIATPAHRYDLAQYTDMLEGKELEELLGAIVSPRVAELGLKWRGDFHWVGDSNGGIRDILQYSTLKGGRGTFRWGVCLDFVKVASGNKLVFNRTERSARLHLFEDSMAYADTFNGAHIADGEGRGVCCHTRSRAAHTIGHSIDFILGDIKKSFERTTTLPDVQREAERQVAAMGLPGNIYKFHSPPPAYVLAFVYAELGKYEDAFAVLASIQDTNGFYKLAMVRAYLASRDGNRESRG